VACATESNGRTSISLSRVTSAGSTAICWRLLGELDCSTADEVVAAVTRDLDGGSGVLVLDLDALRFCDAAGVAALLRVHAHARANGTDVVLCGARGTVRRVFDIVELDRVIPLASRAPLARVTDREHGAASG
jgi:anti-sigma B factor antagonist